MTIPSQGTITEQLIDYIYKNFPRVRQKSTGVTDKLLDQRLIDSLGLLEILTFIEETFEITVKDEDVKAENMGTIEAMAAYIKLSLDDVAS